MLNPNQFHVKEAWIAFKLNDAPIQTDLDGAFNCLALMDAASCFILGSEFIPAGAAEPSKMEARRLLKKGQSPQAAVTQNALHRQRADGRCSCRGSNTPEDHCEPR